MIDAEAEDCRTDAFSSFILRTRGYNSAKTIRQKLEMAAALFNNNLLGLPFVLKLRKKSTPISYNTPFYYVDLVLACSVMEGAQISKARAEALAAAGLNQEAFEASVEKGMANGPFEDTVEEMLEMEDLLIGSQGTSEAGGMQDTGTAGSEILPPVETPAVLSTGIGLDVLRQFIEGTKTEGLVPA